MCLKNLMQSEAALVEIMQINGRPNCIELLNYSSYCTPHGDWNTSKNIYFTSSSQYFFLFSKSKVFKSAAVSSANLNTGNIKDTNT
jgi:hypothetical protein